MFYYPAVLLTYRMANLVGYLHDIFLVGIVVFTGVAAQVIVYECLFCFVILFSRRSILNYLSIFEMVCVPIGPGRFMHSMAYFYVLYCWYLGETIQVLC